MKAKLSLYLILLAVAGACRKDVQRQQESNVPATTVLNALTEQGFTKKDIQDLGSYYLVDGDLLINKENVDVDHLRKYFKGILKNMANPFDPNARHWVTPDLITGPNIETIKIPTGEFGGTSSGELFDWQQSARTAMSHWAGISNTSINFTRRFYGSRTFNSTSINTIHIVDDGGTLPNNVIAAAEFPSSGFAGWRVRVNLDFNSNVNVPDGQRVYNLVHEIGHCLGFRHTNWQLVGESQNGASAVLTTSASQDPLSVMNGGTANFSWSGFSTDDAIAAQTVYPQPATFNWLTSPNGGKYPAYTHLTVVDYTDPIAITWNASLVSTSTVTLQIYKGGSLIHTIGTNIANTGSINFPIAQYGHGAIEDTAYELQIKIISNDNPAVFDFSPMFSIFVENNNS